MYSLFLGINVHIYSPTLKVSPGNKLTDSVNSCVPQSKLLILGMGDLPPLIRNPYNGYINPYYKVDDHPYHRKTMGV